MYVLTHIHYSEALSVTKLCKNVRVKELLEQFFVENFTSKKNPRSNAPRIYHKYVVLIIQQILLLLQLRELQQLLLQ